jgi:hypothetical protein
MNDGVEPPPDVALRDMTLQQLRDAQLRASVEQRVVDLDRIEREISHRHSINDYH